MKKTTILILFFALAFLPGLVASQSAPIDEYLQPEPADSGMPGWPTPNKPIPHHDAGKPSNAVNYVTEVTRLNDEGVEETVLLTGLDAMVADGADPLAGNYTLVNLDKIMMSWNANNQQSVQTFASRFDTIDTIPGSQSVLDNYRSMDIAAGDFNNDGQSEQIVAWLDPADSHIRMSLGEMPGSLGRTTSAPATVAHGGAPPDGYSLEFDGSDDYVNAGSGINLSASSFTVAFWAKRDSTGTSDIVVGQGSTAINQGLHIGFRTNDKFTCAFWDNDLDTAVYDNTGWHHWACTYDADSNLRTIYRDGVRVAQDVTLEDYQGSGELDIGRVHNDLYSFDGVVDGVGIWNVARTQDQIQAELIRPAAEPDEVGLVAYWSFDEGSGATAGDIMGDHYGTLMPDEANGPQWNDLESAPLGEVHLLLRGYDEALWHCVYDLESGGCLGWDNSAGGILLAAPAVASLEAGQFDAFVVGIDNENDNKIYIFRRHWEGGWSGNWQQYADWPYPAPTWTGPTPELSSPAVVARNGGFDLFRVGPDNTLRWHDGTNWQSLGGMLASGPGAVSLGADHMQVFARGVDETLWHLTYSGGSWGAWQRLPLDGMDEAVTIASAPTAISPGSGRMNVYVRGSDNQLWQITFNGSSWGTWLSLGGSLASGVAVAQGNIFAQAEDGSLQQGDGAVWTPLGGLPPCCAIYDTGLVGALKDVYPFEDYSVDVETGYFLGDGRSQIVVAYEEPSSGDVKTTLFQTVGGFGLEQVEVGEVTIPHDVDWFKIATGDFLDGDGIDEVVLAYVHDQSYGVDIVRLSPEGSEVAIEGDPATDDTTCGWGNKMRFAGTLEVVSGDFDADGQDEIAMTVLLSCEDWETSPSCHSYRYHARTRVFDILKNPDFDLETYYVNEESYRVETERNRSDWTVHLALAAGDVDGDGKDEIIRTWPDHFDDHYNWCMVEHFRYNDRFYRRLEIWELPDNADEYTNTWDENGDAVIDGAALLNDPAPVMGRTERSYVDRLAAGDLDRDLKEEPVWHIGTNGDRILRTYDYDDPDWKPTESPLPFVWYPNLVTGDFTGESLRVGPPNYRRQYSVGRITAIINAPPKHVDVLDGVEYNINADDPETKAELTLGEGTTTHVSLTTMRDWGLSTTFATTIGNPEASHTTNSLTTSYGENFSDQDGYVTTFEIQQTREASADDALFYIRTDYDVWEYPVLVDPTGTAADYITVVYPVSAPRLRVDRGNTCDSWYRPRHQLDNVWSYPSRAEQLVDRDEGGGGDLVSGSDYLVSDDPSSFTVNFTEVEETKQTSGFDLGISNEFEWQIGGEELGFEIFGMSFSTRLPSFKFSSKADYNYSQLAEWEVTTTDSTEVFGYLNGVPGGDTAGYDYAVWPYLYWTEGGYLMLDYTTSTEGTFWTRYDKPDPAFTLPWADGQCNTADEPQTEAFTRDILADPPVVSAGDTVTLTATVRNFSLHANPHAFSVTFYLGEPDNGGTQIGTPQTIGAYQLGPRDVETVTVHWTATGSGDQRIYAVIDPTNQLAEVHDETDPYVNNNKGYGLVRLGALDFVDMGETGEEIYYPITYRLNPTMQASLFVPVGNLTENTRFDFQDANLAVTGIGGKAFELLAYRGEENWDTPEENYSFQPDTDHPPAVITLSYGNGDITGMDETNLNLYRLEDDGWVVATCANYEAHRFAEDNLLAVPICETGIFVLSDNVPGPSGMFLPMVSRR